MASPYYHFDPSRNSVERDRPERATEWETAIDHSLFGFHQVPTVILAIVRHSRFNLTTIGTRSRSARCKLKDLFLNRLWSFEQLSHWIDGSRIAEKCFSYRFCCMENASPPFFLYFYRCNDLTTLATDCGP